MNNSILKIYALAVCFTSLMCAAITGGFFLYNIVKITAPELTISPYRLEAYGMHGPYLPPVARAGPLSEGSGAIYAPGVGLANAYENEPKLTEKEILAVRAEARNAVISTHVLEAKQGLIQQGIILLIVAVLYGAHWRLAKRITQES